jgi:hypothetical protein
MLLGKAVLGISAVVFIGYGFISLLSPAIPAGYAGLSMNNGDAFAEIGAMYGGVLPLRFSASRSRNWRTGADSLDFLAGGPGSCNRLHLWSIGI